MSYQMARYYAEKIIPRMLAVQNIIRKINQRSVTPETFEEKRKSFSGFTKSEAVCLFSDDILDKFANEINTLTSEDDLAEFFSQYHRIPELKIKRDWANYLCDASSESDKDQLYKDLAFNMQRDIADVFNHLEYFSMYFYSGLAESETVYVSLHQTFLDFVATSYLYIAAKNQSAKHAYFLHTIALYKKWMQHSEIDTQIEQQNINRAEQMVLQAKGQPGKPKKLRHHLL